MSAPTPVMNRFPCGHFDSTSYCRECKQKFGYAEHLKVSQIGFEKPDSAARAEMLRSACLAEVQELQRRIAKAGRKNGKEELIAQHDLAMERYRKAKRWAIEWRDIEWEARKLPDLAPSPDLIGEVLLDEEREPMRNADFLLYLRGQHRAGRTGAIPRPYVRRASGSAS